EHCSIANRLQFGVACVFCPFEFDDHEVCILIESEQVNSPLAVLPVAKLLRDHHSVWSNDPDFATEKPLKVGSFTNFLLNKRRPFASPKPTSPDLVDRHA